MKNRPNLDMFERRRQGMREELGLKQGAYKIRVKKNVRGKGSFDDFCPLVYGEK